MAEIVKRCGNCKFVAWEENEEYSGYQCDNPKSIKHEDYVQSSDLCDRWEEYKIEDRS